MEILWNTVLQHYAPTKIRRISQSTSNTENCFCDDLDNRMHFRAIMFLQKSNQPMQYWGS